jgi:hypothetical protein
MRSHPSDLTPDLVTQNPDSSNQKNSISWGKRPTVKGSDVSTTFTDILDGTFVPTALHHVVRLNGTGFPGMFPSLFM